jgi:hypothetical protein
MFEVNKGYKASAYKSVKEFSLRSKYSKIDETCIVLVKALQDSRVKRLFVIDNFVMCLEV